MTRDLFASASWLKAENNRGFGPLPIPQPTDNKITELLRAWVSLPASERSAAASEILEDQRFTLLAYSERMASLAVRTGDTEKIFLGLLALGIDGWRSDWRDNALILSPHYDATQRLGVDAPLIFGRAADLLSPKVATAYDGFLNRSNDDKSLKAMGYLAGSDPNGFRYLRTW
jgi:hypothetical protein